MYKACMKEECLGHLEQFPTIVNGNTITLSICDECGGAWVHTLYDDTAFQLTEDVIAEPDPDYTYLRRPNAYV